MESFSEVLWVEREELLDFLRFCKSVSDSLSLSLVRSIRLKSLLLLDGACPIGLRGSIGLGHGSFVLLATDLAFQFNIKTTSKF